MDKCEIKLRHPVRHWIWNFLQDHPGCDLKITVTGNYKNGAISKSISGEKTVEIHMLGDDDRYYYYYAEIPLRVRFPMKVTNITVDVVPLSMFGNLVCEAPVRVFEFPLEILESNTKFTERSWIDIVVKYKINPDEIVFCKE